jgi:APA family basic amino acid/polyamine antiporter
VNPSRDVPLAILLSCGISSVLYILTGIALIFLVPYTEIDVHAPLSSAFSRHGLEWMSTMIALGAFTGITSALLVQIVSQARVWFALADDGLIPKMFARVHPTYGTPYTASIASGIFAAVFASFLDLEALAKLIAIGTLFAFAVVATCLLFWRHQHDLRVVWSTIGIWALSFATNVSFRFTEAWVGYTLIGLTVCCAAPVFFIPKKITGANFVIPLGPLIPILSISTNVHAMCALGLTVWLRFLFWTVIGVIFYLVYGMHHSRLRMESGEVAAENDDDDKRKLLGGDDSRSEAGTLAAD